VSENQLRVRKIRDGTVIDHIPAGRALQVLRILGITGMEGFVVAIVMNVESKKLGRKDIVKIEGRFLDLEEVNKISLIAPTATINIIKGYRVVSKTRVSIPDKIEGILKCMNPNCITNQPREPIKPSFLVVSKSPIKLICEYCNQLMVSEDVVKQLVGEL